MTTSLKRIGGLLLFLALPLVLLALSAFNVLDGLERRDAAQLQGALQTRLEARLRMTGDATSARDTADVYLSGGNAALAGAALRQRMVEAIAAVNGQLIETRSTDLSQDFPAEQGWVSVSASFTMPNQALHTLLSSLETGLPLLVVDALSIRRDDQGDASPADPSLRIDLTLRGARRTTSP